MSIIRVNPVFSIFEKFHGEAPNRRRDPAVVASILGKMGVIPAR
jgi:hypothetical protein